MVRSASAQYTVTSTCHLLYFLSLFLKIYSLGHIVYINISLLLTMSHTTFVDAPLFVCLFVAFWETFNYLQFEAMMNKLLNICLQMFTWVYTFIRFFFLIHKEKDVFFSDWGKFIRFSLILPLSCIPNEQLQKWTRSQYFCFP